MRRLLLALLALAVAAVVAVAVAGGFEGDTGTPAKASGTRLPDVTLSALRSGDKPVDLGSLKGPAVVNLWANWCKPCRKELPIIERFHQARPGVRVIGINALDTQPGLARQVASAAGVTYPLVVDPDQAVRAIALPRTLLVDGRGRIAYSAYTPIKSLSQLEGLVEQHLPDSDHTTAGAAR